MKVIICNYFIFLLNLGHAILIPGVAFLFAWGSEQRYSNQECLQYGMFLSDFLEQVRAVPLHWCQHAPAPPEPTLKRQIRHRPPTERP